MIAGDDGSGAARAALLLQQHADRTNNGTSDVDYAASITQQTQAPPSTAGWFRGGQNYNSSMSMADFDQSYSPINGGSVSAGGAPLSGCPFQYKSN